jgi:hypothetical protein
VLNDQKQRGVVSAGGGAGSTAGVWVSRDGNWHFDSQRNQTTHGRRCAARRGGGALARAKQLRRETQLHRQRGAGGHGGAGESQAGDLGQREADADARGVGIRERIEFENSVGQLQ